MEDLTEIAVLTRNLPLWIACFIRQEIWFALSPINWDRWLIQVQKDDAWRLEAVARMVGAAISEINKLEE